MFPAAGRRRGGGARYEVQDIFFRDRTTGRGRQKINIELFYAIVDALVDYDCQVRLVPKPLTIILKCADIWHMHRSARGAQPSTAFASELCT